MVGFGRKCQKLGRKQGLVENRWLSWLVYSGYRLYRCYSHKDTPKGQTTCIIRKKPTISPAQQHPQKTSNKYFKTENIFVNLRKNF